MEPIQELTYAELLWEKSNLPRKWLMDYTIPDWDLNRLRWEASKKCSFLNYHLYKDVNSPGSLILLEHFN